MELRRIVTFTRIPDTGERVKVSGLLAVPVGARGTLPLLSWQHGTILSFDQVPSNLLRLKDENYELRDNVDSIETLFNIQRFAGNGYAVVAADYVGKGPYRNGRSEAYAVKGATVQCCLDILTAGLHELRTLSLRQSNLFLNGWSQGALNTQWLKQELQRRGIKVRATATQSPFNDLAESFHYWTNPTAYIPASETSYPMPPAWITPCLIVLLGSYRRYYGLTDLFKTAVKPHIKPSRRNTGPITASRARSRRAFRPPAISWSKASSIASPTRPTAHCCAALVAMVRRTGSTIPRSDFTTGWPMRRCIPGWCGPQSPPAGISPRASRSMAQAIAARSCRASMAKRPF
ncbi:lipase family protein [Bradyrhizobium sp. NBAIM32]|uniref:alpha/beta hydrolase family protein n=1 Tax=Bradyrhizobium sp. NBAIM32 TaxID=2793809 RepID=UPI001CD5C553|nr:lipase family protein [Bradyrhizobium sp. NBAIM32]